MSPLPLRIVFALDSWSPPPADQVTSSSAVPLVPRPYLALLHGLCSWMLWKAEPQLSSCSLGLTPSLMVHTPSSPEFP